MPSFEEIEPKKHVSKEDIYPRRKIALFVKGLAILGLIGCGSSGEVDRVQVEPSSVVEEPQAAPEGANSVGQAQGEFSWVSIPAGTFQMGSSSESDYASPVHRVTLGAFELSATEVTVGQYRRCVDAGVCIEPINCNSWEPNFNMPSREAHPVNCVSWSNATTFAAWAGFRLPTEAEWEYAAIGGESFTYAGSDAVADVGWVAENSEDSTHPVGGKRANGYGLFDMTGNVSEWVSDLYDVDYYGRSSTTNPENSSSGLLHVIRGGSWYDESAFASVRFRSSARNGGGRFDYRDGLTGFRLAR